MKFRKCLPLVVSLMTLSVIAPIATSCSNNTTQKNEDKASIKVDSANGTVKLLVDGKALDGKKEVEVGKTVKIEVTCETGFEVEKVEIKGEAAETTSEYEFKVISKGEINVVITYKQVEAKEEFSSVELKTSEQGKVEVKDSSIDLTKVKVGTVIELVATPNEGFKLSKIEVNGVALEGTTFEIKEANTNYVVEAFFEEEAKDPTPNPEPDPQPEPEEPKPNPDVESKVATIIPEIKTGDMGFALKATKEDFNCTNIALSEIKWDRCYREEIGVRISSSKNDGFFTFTFDVNYQISKIVIYGESYKNDNAQPTLVINEKDYEGALDSSITYDLGGLVETNSITLKTVAQKRYTFSKIDIYIGESSGEVTPNPDPKPEPEEPKPNPDVESKVATIIPEIKTGDMGFGLKATKEDFNCTNIALSEIKWDRCYREEIGVRISSSKNDGFFTFTFDVNYQISKIVVYGESYKNDNAQPTLVINEKDYEGALDSSITYDLGGLVETNSITLKTVAQKRYTFSKIDIYIGESSGEVTPNPDPQPEPQPEPEEPKPNPEVKPDENPNGFDYLYANDKIKPTRGSLGDYDAYYEPIRGLKGPELKAGLNKLIKGHKTFGYKTLNEAMKVTDVDPFDSSKMVFTYEGSLKMGTAYNKEHTWAKSVGDFGTSTGPGSDMHHLRPSDQNLNSTRSNFDFAEVKGGNDCGKAYKWSRPSMEGNFVGGQKFEPKDEFKGDVARMIFYMATRYEGGDGYLDLEVGSSKGTIDGIDSSKYYTFKGATGIHGSFNDLYKWATSTIDPVSNFEVNRNNLIDEKYQHNRNPFIDHPEFIQMIYDKNYTGPGALNDK